MPVFLLATQLVAISLLGPSAKINHSVKMRAYIVKWDFLLQIFVILASLHFRLLYFLIYSCF